MAIIKLSWCSPFDRRPAISNINQNIKHHTQISQANLLPVGSASSTFVYMNMRFEANTYLPWASVGFSLAFQRAVSSPLIGVSSGEGWLYVLLAIMMGCMAGQALGHIQWIIIR